MVDVPTLEPPLPIKPATLIANERDHQTRLPLPELDLDHSLLAAHDLHARNNKRNITLHTTPAAPSSVKIALFGSESHKKAISLSKSS